MSEDKNTQSVEPQPKAYSGEQKIQKKGAGI